MQPRRRLLWALALSLLLHVLLLLAPASLPPPTPPSPPLLARLESLPPARPAPPRPKARADAPAPRASPLPETAEPEEAPTPGPEAAPAEARAQVDEPPPPAAPPPLPARIAITYTLVKGDQGLVVGRMTHQWEAAEGRYTVTSIAHATGLFALFVPGTLIQVSQGMVTSEGVRPLHFWIQRGQSGNRTESAAFDWATGTLRFGRTGEERTAPLVGGSQDVLSVFYQLAFTAPHADVLELPVTNGRKYDRYRYRIVGEDTLDTPLGPLVTEHLERMREAGEDGLEVWLARDYHYLPVKIRLTDRKGEVAEQIVAEIRAE